MFTVSLKIFSQMMQRFQDGIELAKASNHSLLFTKWQKHRMTFEEGQQCSTFNAVLFGHPFIFYPCTIIQQMIQKMLHKVVHRLVWTLNFEIYRDQR